MEIFNFFLDYLTKNPTPCKTEEEHYLISIILDNIGVSFNLFKIEHRYHIENEKLSSCFTAFYIFKIQDKKYLLSNDFGNHEFDEKWLDKLSLELFRENFGKIPLVLDKSMLEWSLIEQPDGYFDKSYDMLRQYGKNLLKQEKIATWLADFEKEKLNFALPQAHQLKGRSSKI